MKIKLEKIQPDSGSSFRILVNPKLNDRFYWHYHPEYELIFISGANGTRHIGEHISRYEDSDLVFIGPNIPHLNFDYGIRSDYEKIVIQMNEDFLNESLQRMPELADIKLLFDHGRKVVLFHGQTKLIIGQRLKKLIQETHFRQFIELLEIFQVLATSTEYTILGIKPIEENYNLKEQQRLKKIYHFVEQNYQQKIDVKTVIDLCNLSNATFCRYFKKMTQMTFTEFLNQYRINQAQKLLLQDYNVTEACFLSGFENLSYFNKSFKKLTGENPTQFKKKHLTLGI
jgi:AraC-like DNA-binding protein